MYILIVSIELKFPQQQLESYTPSCPTKTRCLHLVLSTPSHSQFPPPGDPLQVGARHFGCFYKELGVALLK